MNVHELIEKLQRFDPEMNVYVLALDGTTQIAVTVEQFPHLNLPEGTAMSDDVWILPYIEECEVGSWGTGGE